MSNNSEGTQPCPSTENLIKDLLSMTPPIRTRSSFPHSEFLPLGSFHKPLIFLSIWVFSDESALIFLEEGVCYDQFVLLAKLC